MILIKIPIYNLKNFILILIFIEFCDFLKIN